MSPGTPRSVSVCLPALDEAGNLEAMSLEIAAAIRPCFDHVEIVVVDDGSRDDTPQVLARLCAQDGSLRVVRHERTRGYGAACRSALGDARNEALLLTDADRQFDLRDIARFVEALQGAHVVIGYRTRRRDPWRRIVSGWLWSRLVNLLLGYTARDVNCAFKLMRREVFDAIAPALRCDGAAFNAEWLGLARRAGFRVRELPVGHRPRLTGRPTGGHPRVILKGLGELVRIRRRLGAAGPRQEGSLPGAVRHGGAADVDAGDGAPARTDSKSV